MSGPAGGGAVGDEVRAKAVRLICCSDAKIAAEPSPEFRPPPRSIDGYADMKLPHLAAANKQFSPLFSPIPAAFQPAAFQTAAARRASLSAPLAAVAASRVTAG